MYFYLFICIQYVLCIFRLPTADVTEEMSFYLRRNKDWLIDWLIDWVDEEAKRDARAELAVVLLIKDEFICSIPVKPSHLIAAI